MVGQETTQTGIISLWKALGFAYGGSNYTTIPRNIAASLILYYFLRATSSGEVTLTAIPFDNVTGLPTQPVVEQYPDGVVVDNSSAYCVMFLLLWTFSAAPQPPNPYSAVTYVGAFTGKLYSDPRDMSMTMTCPSGSTTETSIS